MNRQSQIVNLPFLILSGLIAAAGLSWMAFSSLPLGSPRFLAAVAIAVAGYGLALVAMQRTSPTRVALLAIVLLTLAMRLPMAMSGLGSGSDMYRYVWDARVQRAGLSPYSAVPSDPALDHLHTSETRKMNNVNITSPYPPGAQLFFRLATSAGETAHRIKLVLIACDLATALLLALWLRSSGRNPLFVIAYAWNPLVVSEVAFSGHLDAAGMLMTAAAAFALVRGRLALSVLALAAGIAIKFLPLVLIPLWWKRARLTHAALGAGALALLYVMFIDISSQTMPVGSVTNMIRGFRFNGPVFKGLAFLLGPWLAAAAGVAAGLLCAAWFRQSRAASDPAAFAWPMAIALVCSPVIYPWYLLWLTPFFISRLAWPLVLWSVMIPAVYIVWHQSGQGGIWAVPIWMGLVEYATLFGGSFWLWRQHQSAFVDRQSTIP